MIVLASRPPCRSRAGLLALAAVALVVPAVSQGLAVAQGLTAQQVMQLRYVAAVAPSPDGQWLAFTVRAERPLADGPGPGRTTAFVMPIGGGDARPLSDSRGLRWRPGSDQITYLASREGDPHPQVYGRPAAGGDETLAAAVAAPPIDFEWSPDGARIAFTALDPMPDSRRRARDAGFAPEVYDEDFQHVSLWVQAGAAATQVTHDATVQAFAWAPGGERIAVALSPRNSVDDSYMFTRLHVADLETGKVVRVVDNPGKLGRFAWSPDGRRLAYLSAADRNDPHHGMLYAIDVGSNSPVALTDGLRGAVEHFEWIGPDRLDVLISRGVESILVQMPAEPGTGFATAFDAIPSQATTFEIDLGDRTARASLLAGNLPACTGFATLPDGGRVLAGSTATHPPELFRIDGDDRLTRLTDSNPWLGKVTLGKQQATRVPARDGLEIEGLLIFPTDHRAGTRYPMVIVAHGGPEAHYLDGWNTRYSEPGQVLAGMGYVVWYPNYRASTGYGVAFAKADHGDPMGREFEDHLDAIAAFAERDWIDRDRVGVIGGSYGGYTAAWAATRHSAHFAAAVSFVPFVDIRTKWLTSDVPWEFYLVHYQEKWPHEQTGFLADRSPLTHAAQCRTPLLLCGGTADPRVHPSQPHMLYRAVRQSTDTPCRYVRYDGEGHGNARNVNRYDYMLRSIGWLDHYLGVDGHRRRPPPPVDLEYPVW